MAPIASMMCVWGEMGYAQTTSGLQRATVSATALDPSICRSTFELLFGLDDQLVGRRGRGDVSFCGGAREPLSYGERYGLEGDLRGERREAAEQHGIGQGATEVLECEFRCWSGKKPFAVERP
jgi:hypothetical protein